MSQEEEEKKNVLLVEKKWQWMDCHGHQEKDWCEPVINGTELFFLKFFSNFKVG
jgi:hypothetical protein